MLSRKFFLIIFVSLAYSQNITSGYGYGSFSSYSSASSASISSDLLPSFKTNISQTNPSTWHNLLFTYLSTSIDFQNTVFQSQDNSSFSFSSAKLIIPWKQKLAFGISFEPFLSRELTVNDTTLTSFTFNDEEFSYLRTNNSSGGPSLGRLSYGYKLNEFDSIGGNLNIIFGSSRNTRNLIIENESHLLQSRDYFSGSTFDIYYSTSRLVVKEKQILIALSLSLPLNGINVRNDSYQAFIDLNDNNYHDSNDFPDIGQALLPLSQTFDNEIRITDLSAGFDYEFKPRKHFQIGINSWKDNGRHLNDSSIFNDFIERKTKLSVGYVKFAQPFSKERFNFKSSLFLQNHKTKNLENISEFGLGFGLDFNFGITGNQINLSYVFSKKSGLLIVDKESLHTLNIGVSIGDLWFVKRREI